MTSSPSRWARWAAYGVPLAILPSTLYRFTLVPDDATIGEKIYIPGLSIVSFAFALLAVGLVRPWGETVPDWVPFAGGRTLAVRTVVVPAAVVSAALTLAFTYGLLNHFFGFVEPGAAPVLIGEERPDDVTDLGVAGGAAYLPVVAWGPLLAVATYAYHRRRTSVERAPVPA
ncbi:hypothetical protein [Actinomadura sp. 7K507]|uniref:hypothetical protein n=1 Tax=Actinomadura sp. 7K507 TaxID=2530365 RepID=UPI001049B777|nr:hypothetical protein [Actinomadura sp. 7K507]TDC85103.1 hypothetical protein E1285_25735 [Actinomadura sp. 7K507]